MKTDRFSALNTAREQEFNSFSLKHRIHLSIDLNDKVDDFIKWYSKKVVKGRYTNIGEYWEPKELRNFIEKMAVWYELRYPDYEIGRLMAGFTVKHTKIGDVMFNHNKYINDSVDKDSEVRLFNWELFYNKEAFINSLPPEEQALLETPEYPKLIYIDSGPVAPPINQWTTPHLHLTSDGFIEKAEGLEVYSHHKIKDDQLKNMHIKEVIQLCKEKNIDLVPLRIYELELSELEKAVMNYEQEAYRIPLKEGILDCVMYRIIERGGNRIGPRRAFLFAKEFGRNIDIPMMFGVDVSDPNLRSFINEYIKAGGSKDLVCYMDYFSKAKKHEILFTVTVQEMIKIDTEYTPEETALHQRLVNALASQINQDELKKELDKQNQKEPEIEEKKQIKQLKLRKKFPFQKKLNDHKK